MKTFESGKLCIHDCRNAHRTNLAIRASLRDVFTKAFGEDYSEELELNGPAEDRGYGPVDALLSKTSKGAEECLRGKHPHLPSFKLEWVLELSSEGHSHIGFFRIKVPNNG